MICEAQKRLRCSARVPLNTNGQAAKDRRLLDLIETFRKGTSMPWQSELATLVEIELFFHPLVSAKCITMHGAISPGPNGDVDEDSAVLFRVSFFIRQTYWPVLCCFQIMLSFCLLWSYRRTFFGLDSSFSTATRSLNLPWCGWHQQPNGRTDGRRWLLFFASVRVFIILQ